MGASDFGGLGFEERHARGGYLRWKTAQANLKRFRSGPGTRSYQEFLESFISKAEQGSP